jgi:hypothetical protein
MDLHYSLDLSAHSHDGLKISSQVKNLLRQVGKTSCQLLTFVQDYVNGYHPVKIGDEFSDSRYIVVKKARLGPFLDGIAR